VKQSIRLIVTSVLTILFATFHLADDIVRGFSPGGLSNLGAILFLVVWLYATLALPERRSGLVIILVGSLLSSGLPVIHMTGKGLGGGRIAGSVGAFFFVWTLIAAGVTAIFSLLLAARGLWSLRRGLSR
jgi:hypothetical protein